jgi:hypothetical protein
MAGAHQTELAALARAVSRPHFTDLEIETQIRLAEYDDIGRRINETPADLKLERTLAALEAIRDHSSIELRRASAWSKVGAAARRIAVGLVGFPKERANEDLKRFNAFERGRIWCEIDSLIADLKRIQKCMQGGDVPQADSCEWGGRK